MSHFLNKAGRWLLQRVARPAPSTDRIGSAQLADLLLQHQGRPFVFDEGNLRFMYFNQRAIQSAMKLDAPNELLCGYTVAMMAFLWVKPAPKRILMVGLGGGSLLKFCRSLLPDSHITVLEIDADVIALRDQFMIPVDDERLSIIHCDAIDYLNAQPLQVDALLLDGFDAVGMVEELATSEFFAACHQALSPDGVLVVNMWGKRRQLAAALQRLRARFDARVWCCRSPDSYNLIAFALRDGCAGFEPASLAELPAMNAAMTASLTQLLGNMQDSRAICAASSGSAVRELDALTEAIAAMMTPDPGLPRNDAEWSVAHR
ncbi:fused MFS/spermidine synthase [Roseateles oligotrophus]|uniref:Fused MFS/spermidine synthase n=1 Tax=Roseateles oligotrophus TaxID=1769250 RepID=A0ABT2YB29_9BURK|nr:fused MFS/spermidine synthase [Roseateles oligotrophus]MCV2367511.1 fused MFS/spermidine synthase [Roseateles oligotrophus]